MARFKVMNISKLYQKYRKPKQAIPKAIWHNPLYFIAFGFGSGAIPFSPGTFGTLAAVPFYLLLRPVSLTTYALFVIILIIASSWLCDYVSRAIRVNDHPGMCIDEFPGFFVAMFNAPPGWQWLVIGFLLFRLFDIWKPWPIRWIDKRMHSGFGMVLDDVVAGLFAMGTMCFLYHLIA